MVSGVASAERGPDAACLIGLDWGSTALRAFLIGADGALLAERASAHGASTLTDGAAFAAALAALAGDWRAARPALPLLACGMVGSQHGWLDVPYVACPADAAALAGGMRRADGGLLIVPGLLQDGDSLPPDVMRGEETQIAGALQTRPELVAQACIVLPGTHSKWARLRQGRVLGFATHMTGELYAVLRQHSVLGRLMPPAAPAAPMDEDAFLAGVDAARDHGQLGLGHQLFAVRSLGVTATMPAAALGDYLSGLLIGHEVRAGLDWRAQAGLAAAPLALVGEPRLCRRYARALLCFGQDATLTLDNTAPAGLLRLARAAGLL